ncbi:PAS domain S-box-containing protein [Granulicella pectinivorans]|uniref:histidine kinase n=2 Tax=Granulicella pectinivorans TaxID=474950 RepID=A0A1I6MC60_9BACT|nr:PAS domain S-box-containing protein [Granulicella pectinivorans]
MVAGLAWLEWLFQLDYSLGLLYLFPVILASTAVVWWQVPLVALLCAFTRGQFDLPVTELEHWLRFLMATVAYSGCGLLVNQITSSRRKALAQYLRIRFEQRLRHRAEDQLRLLAESSPAAILTIGSEGNVSAANRAAHQMLGFEGDDSLVDQPIAEYFPIFLNALHLNPEIEQVRTSATTWAKRKDHSSFPAATWFSIYGTGRRRNLAAIVVDNSEEVRERERMHYEQLASHSQVLAGAVSHEIRNLCSAIAVVGSNLDRRLKLENDLDFGALKNLIEALGRLASFDLSKRQKMQPVTISLAEIAQEFSVIVEPDWNDAGGTVAWTLPEDLPRLQADPHSLLQVLLNLSQNALKASAQSERKELRLEAEQRGDFVALTVRDAGPGVEDASHLFKAFTPSATGSGLGLYISREMVKSFDGDLRYIPTEEGCCFEITVPITMSAER